MNNSRIVLDKRLSCVAELCGDLPGIMADIGTDHGLLPVALLKTGKAHHCFACDISDASLQKARTLAIQQGLWDKLSFRVTDGLSGLLLSEIDTITVCGMGADNIIGILDKRKVELLSKRLILQPNSKEHKLRKYLYENGFEIHQELACSEGKHIYVIMWVEYKANPSVTPPPFFCYAGKVDKAHSDGRAYLKQVIKKLEIKYEAQRSSHSNEAQGVLLGQLIAELSDYLK